MCQADTILPLSVIANRRLAMVANCFGVSHLEGENSMSVAYYEVIVKKKEKRGSRIKKRNLVYFPRHNILIDGKRTSSNV